MKDLATMRDPTSSYTFTNYLHKHGRLASFINREASVPSRREWSAYLHWAAKRMDDVVTYGREIVRVEPEDHRAGAKDGSSVVRKWRLVMRDTASGETYECLAKHVTVAIGGIPVTPEPFDQLLAAQANSSTSSYIAHSSVYLPALAGMESRLRRKEARTLSVADDVSQPSRTPLRFAVIGSGQSAAEITLHLRKTFPNAHVSLIFRASALVPSDDSAFVNAMAFDPERTDAHWRAGQEERCAWLKEFRRTNYAVVRSDVLNELHTAVYDQGITFAQPWPNADGPEAEGGELLIRPNTQIDTARLIGDHAVNDLQEEDDTQVALTVRDLVYPTSSKASSVQDRTETFDAVFLATGFKRSPEHVPFLQPLQSLYPRLDPDAEQKKAALGFAGEQDSFEVLKTIVDDEAECERLRHRTRGITRDYRLVSYSSDAFDPPRSGVDDDDRRTSAGNMADAHTRTLPRSNADSGASTPRRGSDMSDSDTLADSDENIAVDVNTTRDGGRDEEESRLRGPRIEASIYFLGGNEASHGLSDSLLSIVAHRAGELTTSILRRSRSNRRAAAADRASAKIDAAQASNADEAVADTLRKRRTTLLDTVQQTVADLRV